MLDSHLQLSCFRHDGNFLCRCSAHKAWESRTLCMGESSYPNNFISFTLSRQHLVVIIATKHGAGFATKIHFYPIPWKYFLLFHAVILFMPYGNEWKRFGQAKNILELLSENTAVTCCLEHCLFIIHQFNKSFLAIIR